MSHLKKLLKKGTQAASATSAIVADLEQHSRNTGSGLSFIGTNASGAALGLEGFKDDAIAQSELEGASAALENLMATIGGSNLTNAQREAGTMMAMASGDLGSFFRADNRGGSDSLPAANDIGRIKAAMESYDEKENKAAALYSIAYNLQASRQDDFGEAFFPTVVVAPDQQGYHIQLNIVNLINGVRRAGNGSLNDWNRTNIVNVIRNPGLINSTSTKMIPVYRAGSEQNFVNVANVPTWTVDQGGETVTTGALAIGKQFELIGLSQTELQLDQNNMDETDSIDTDILLKNLYIQVGTDTLKFPATHLPGAQFVYPIQGDQQRMDVRVETEALSIDKNTKELDGTALDTLAPVVAGDLQVYLRVVVHGSVVRDKGNTELTATAVRVSKIINAAGDVFQPDSSSMAAIVALFANAQVIGYDLEARRTNLNRRSAGQQLETRQEKQAYAVPLLSPFTVKRPLGLNDTTDASDLASLVTLTRAMASGAAVTELFKAAETLKALAAGRRPLGDNLKVLGIARELVTAHYHYGLIEVDAAVQTRNSAELAANIQATIINVLRDAVYRAYQESGYKAAADMLAGGPAPKPTIIIGTDQTLGRYLQVSGDLRTFSGEFDDVIIVDTQNEKMKGKIFVTFGVKEASEGIPHPLHFGNMAWKPEVTVVLPIHRNGANSKELTVQPAFRHIVNLPVLLEFDVTGIPETVSTRVPSVVEVTGDVNTTETP